MEEPSCIFCKIIRGEIHAKIYYRDDLVTAFQDTHPRAPTHILIVPNRHMDSINKAAPEDAALLGHMLLVARQLAEEKGIAQSGFRLVINTGPDGGQSVHHLHLHLLGGTRIHIAFETPDPE